MPDRDHDPRRPPRRRAKPHDLKEMEHGRKMEHGAPKARGLGISRVIELSNWAAVWRMGRVCGRERGHAGALMVHRPS